MVSLDVEALAAVGDGADEAFDREPSRCARCSAKLRDTDSAPVIDRVIDLPAELRHVVHRLRHTLEWQCCPGAPVPQAASEFDPELTGVTAYRMGGGRLGTRAVRTATAPPSTTRSGCTRH